MLFTLQCGMRSCLRRAGTWLALAACLAAAGAQAQTTSGSAANGQAMYDNTGSYNCKTCHGASITTNYAHVRNAANAGGQILYANSKGMGGTVLNATQANDFAAYIANSVVDPAPVNFPVPFNSPGVDISLGQFKLNTPYGGYQGLELVTGPTKGTVTFSGITATYVPVSGQSGADSFSYRAYRLSPPATAAGTSNVRTVTLLIDAAPVPVVTSTSIANGTVGAAFSYTITGTNSPSAYGASGLPGGLSVDMNSGVISGTPTQAGTFNVGLTATNSFGTSAIRALDLTIAKSAQVVTFGPQVSPRAFSAGATFALNPLATASSGLAITYSSTTPATCGVSGATVTMIAPGNCSVRATQAGDSNFLSAFADQSVFLSGAAPVLVTSKLPGGTIGTAYAASLVVGGSPAPVSVDLSGLPSGLVASHNGSGTVTISGTPSQAGSFNVSVTASNGGGLLSTSLSLLVIDESVYANNVTAVSAGGSTCALLSGGVQCWGRGTSGELGNGTFLTSAAPVAAIAAGSGATAISVGGAYACAVVSGGLRCWGYNGSGQLGNGLTDNSSVPVQTIAAGSSVTAVAAGLFHACALVNGGVRCWGSNYNNELGNGTGVDSLVPVQTLPAGSNATSIAVSDGEACAVVAGNVRCWGNGYTGIETIAGISGATAVAIGYSHICALVSGGVVCKGDNYYGQLGDGGASGSESTTPVQAIAAGSGVTALSAGGYVSCALVGGGAKCWGANYFGATGDAAAGDSLSPYDAFVAGSGVTALSTSGGHTCAVVSGRVQCWGYNGEGQLGVVLAAAESTVPVAAIPTGSGATSVAAGGGHACATLNGGVKCWGLNNHGQLGNGTLVSSALPVTAVAENGGAAALATRASHNCIIVGGAAKCWGLNDWGQVGLGNSNDQRAPIQVYDLTSGVGVVAPGGGHTCALVGTGVRCWGRNDSGQLGLGHNSYIYTPSVPLAITGTVTDVAAGSAHTCAVVSGGVQCWGDNFSRQLGISGIKFNLPQQTMPAGSGVTRIAAGAASTCVMANGGVRCWGNLYTANLSVPTVVIPDGSNVTAVAAGDSHVCMLANGGVQCFGSNVHGQLGDGTKIDRAIPVQAIPTGSNATAITAGDVFSCAVINGGVVCWGANDGFQLASVPTGMTTLAKAAKVFPALLPTVAPQYIGFGSIANRLVTDPSFALSASGGGSGNPVVFASTTTAICLTAGTNGTTVSLTGVAGTCSITANQAGNSAFAAAAPVTQSFVVSSGVPNLLSVQSRKTHGVPGFDGDIDVALGVPIAGAITVEPRAIGTGHRLRFVFDGPVQSVSGVTALNAALNPAGAVTALAAGNAVEVTLTGVTDGTRVKVSLPTINGAASDASVTIGFLLGDVNNSYAVNATDVSAIKARAGSIATPAAARYDVNLGGAINAADIAVVKARAAAGAAFP